MTNVIANDESKTAAILKYVTAKNYGFEIRLLKVLVSRRLVNANT